MSRIKVAKNFYLDEFIDPHTYFNTVDHGLSLMDPRVFEIVQLLRDHYGKPIYINNWWGYYSNYKDKLPLEKIISNIEKSNLHKWSGWRSSRCKIGASSSAHKKGKAADPKGPQKTFFSIVKRNAERFYALGLRRLEDISITIGWLHMDTLERNTRPNSIRVVDRVKCTQTITW